MHRRLLSVVVLSAAVSCSHQPALPPQNATAARAGTAPSSSQPVAAPDNATYDRLSTFKSLMDQESLSNDEVLNRLNELNRELRDDQMAAVERFASSDEVGNAAFPLAHILVERGRMDAAANVIVGALLPDPKNREYGMWKWWEYSFRARPDYEQLSRRMIESLIGEFAKGSPERKLVVAELFGKGPAEAQLSTEQFRQVLARDSEPVSQP